MEDQPFDFSTPITKDITLLAKWDCPNGVTIAQLKTALNNGTAATTYPVNTQIDDYTDGNYDPWIVGHYGKQYGDNDTDGVYLYRKYLYPTQQAWGEGETYDKSTVNTWLNTTYLDKCSDNIKNAIAQINVPLVSGTVSAKMFLMSAAEVLAINTSYAGGVAWSGWAARTGLSEPSTEPNQGRIMRDRSSTAKGAWLRSRYGSSGVCYVAPKGYVGQGSPSVSRGVVPACFIAKSAASGPITAQEYNEKNITAKDYNAKAITANDFNNNAKGVL